MDRFDVRVRTHGKAINDLVRKGGFPLAVRTENRNPRYRRRESTSEFRDDKREVALARTHGGPEAGSPPDGPPQRLNPIRRDLGAAVGSSSPEAAAPPVAGGLYQRLLKRHAIGLDGLTNHRCISLLEEASPEGTGQPADHGLVRYPRHRRVRSLRVAGPRELLRLADNRHRAIRLFEPNRCVPNRRSNLSRRSI